MTRPALLEKGMIDVMKIFKQNWEDFKRALIEAFGEAVLSQALSIIVTGVIFLICFRVIYLFAQRKNRGMLSLWGLFGGMFFIPMLLLLAFTSYLCPKCRKVLTNRDGKAKKCPHCAASWIQEDSEAATSD